MPSSPTKSLSRLGTCDPRLQRVFPEVVRYFDCTILEGHRNQERQDRMVEEGKSKVRWPNGKHNTVPSMAVDVTPYLSCGTTRERQTLFAGYVLATAKAVDRRADSTLICALMC